MKNLKIKFKHCYGIPELDTEFVFDNNKAKAFAIYAPNGLMKTSFTKSFQRLSEGNLPEDERYKRTTNCSVDVDGKSIPKEIIYVLKSEIDISSDSAAITNILVDPANKSLYDKLLVDLDNLKEKLLKSLSSLTKVKVKEIEDKMLADWDAKDFPSVISQIFENPDIEDLKPYTYDVIFDSKAFDVLKTEEFLNKASEFNDRYQELFEQAGTIYQKGIFNPTKAETSFSTLAKHGFFAGGHRVHMKGDEKSISKDELDKRIEEIHSKIDSDVALKKLRTGLAKNAQTQALNDLIERLTIPEVNILLEKLKPGNQNQFRKDLWAYYVINSPSSKPYLDSYNTNKSEIERIEIEAAQVAPRWNAAVNLFNDRFVDMPFTLSIPNQAKAVLGKETAQLKFIFKDGGDVHECTRSDVTKTLSQGEKRALYLLNFLFEVEDRKLSNKETLFIIDDIADSFDYKNKHAIIQYLEDLCGVDNFYQLILTHNFDFFRTLCNTFVSYENCWMANRNNSSISLAKARGVKNYFIGEWKDNVGKDEFILCASIPFTRNLIEYAKGDKDANYLTLTSLLHWKADTVQITVGDYFKIYNTFFSSSHDETNTTPIAQLIFSKAQEICSLATHDGLNLENKVLLSIAIRLKAEIYLITELRKLKNDPNYWCQKENQFGYLIKEYSKLAPSSGAKASLEKVGITVSSNIHLNSFMYEPILDLTIEHLIKLHQEICGLTP
jgi:hypothetical protein